MKRIIIIPLLIITFCCGCVQISRILPTNNSNTTSDAQSSVSSNNSILEEETSSVATVTIKIATQEQIDNTANYIHFVDENAINQDWHIILEFSNEVEDFKFIKLDESEKLQVGETLFESDILTPNKPFILHTYINDATYSRGIAYTHKNGDTFYFGISCSMNDGSVSLDQLSFTK